RFRGNDERFRGNDMRFRGNDMRFRGNDERLRGNDMRLRGNDERFRGNDERFRGNDERLRGNDGNSGNWRENKFALGSPNVRFLHARFRQAGFNHAGLGQFAGAADSVTLRLRRRRGFGCKGLNYGKTARPHWLWVYWRSHLAAGRGRSGI
ncbi:MAG: hypothetical protein RQ826_15590, partial [Xanthomonadales bacterium]|nr:hypothetical protein [Xanthomonadales bacterium]